MSACANAPKVAVPTEGSGEIMICPACIANAAVMAASVTSSGGVVAMVVSRIRRFANFRKPGPQAKAKEKQS